MKKEKILNPAAGIIRILSVPPVMVSILIILFYFGGQGQFRSMWEALIMWVCLALIPALAYIICPCGAAKETSEREKQRKTAFILSAVGYGLSLLFALFVSGNGHVIFISLDYVFSLIMLLLINRLTALRASGHGCAVIGPLAIGSFYFGWRAAVICLIFYALILWASLRMKRHTLREFLAGSIICLIAIGMSFALCRLPGLI